MMRGLEHAVDKEKTEGNQFVNPEEMKFKGRCHSHHKL